MENQQALQQLLKVFDTRRIVSPEEVQTVLTGIISLLARFKRENEQLNAETKDRVDELLAKVQEQQARLQMMMTDSMSKSKTDVMDMANAVCKDCMDSMEKMKQEVMDMMPMDGKDANPADVVPLVLEQIKLPENKPFTGEDIVSNINDLPTDDDDLKIDAKHIKNLPKENAKTIIAHSRNLEWFDESTLVISNPTQIKFQGAGVQVSQEATTGALIVTVPGGSGTFADEPMTDSGDHTTFTISNTPNANTLLVINENTGQAVPTSAYTNTTTSVTFSSSQAVDDGTGELITPTFRARYSY